MIFELESNEAIKEIIKELSFYFKELKQYFTDT